jgi:hypothetical protein
MEFCIQNDPDLQGLSVDIGLCFQDRREICCSGISDVDEICAEIGKAQEKILEAKEESKSSRFSKDCVSVRAKGPDLHDLYFYDLPGMFELFRAVYDS